MDPFFAATDIEVLGGECPALGMEKWSVYLARG
jgi:hypothetical protein